MILAAPLDYRRDRRKMFVPDQASCRLLWTFRRYEGPTQEARKEACIEVKNGRVALGVQQTDWDKQQGEDTRYFKIGISLDEICLSEKRNER